MRQGTIKDYDEASGTGSLLTDDREEIAIAPGSVLAGSGVRLLRLGQRVKFEVEERDGRPVARDLRLVTLP
jgi:cold shock CspA family protein